MVRKSKKVARRVAKKEVHETNYVALAVLTAVTVFVLFLFRMISNM